MPLPVTPDTDNTTTRSTSRRSVLLLVLMILIIVVVPMSLGRSRIPVPFDQSVADSFASSNADVVFIGNSLLDNRINPDYLSELIARDATSLAIEGTAPGIWFLQLSNVVAAAENAPKQIFVFFHDDLLTRPIYFTGVEDQRLRESLSHSNISGYGLLPEPKASFVDRASDVFESLYPIASSGSYRDSGPISYIGAGIVGMNNDEATESAINIFGFGFKRDQTTTVQQPKYHGSFQSMIGNSFLPYMLEIATTLDTEIIFVRVAARPNDDGSPNEPETLANYSTDIDTYLTSKNVGYVDMTGHIDEGAIDAAMYNDGYHLKSRFRDHYTEFFAEWMLSNTGTLSDSGGQQ